MMQYNSNVDKSIASGGFRPHQWLTNISIAHFQNPTDFVAPSVFPVVPVDFSTGRYRIFNKADLARDNFQEKPEFGHVNPAVLSSTWDNYTVQVDQILMGLDEIQQVNNSRMNLPGAADPRIAQSKTIAEQALLHLDNQFAKNFFKEGVWGYELSGSTSTDLDSGKTFTKFTDANCEPIKMIRAINRNRAKIMRRPFNTMLIGVDAFDALINHPDILDRVKMGGSTANPAIANETVLAQLFGLQTVRQISSTINTAPAGLPEKMEWICDPKAVLLAYVSPTPSIDQPSAGYIFSWDPTGNRNPINIQTFAGRTEDHSSFIEGLTAFDMHVVCPEMGTFMKEAC